GVIFAGDINLRDSSNNNDTLAITVTDDAVTFQGNIFTTTSTTATIVGGTGTSTVTMNFDTANNENNTIHSTINASAAADTVTLNVTNTNSGATNSTTFVAAIGGTSTTNAIDHISLGTFTTTTFSSTVYADSITVSSTNTSTFLGDVISDFDIAAAGTVSMGSGADITGNVDNTSGTASIGTLILAGGADVTIAGTIGATNSLLAVTSDITGEGAAANTFTGPITATTVTITGTNNSDAVAFQGDITGNLTIVDGATITFSADKKITGSVNTTDQDGILIFSTATTATTLVSGSIAAAATDLKTLNVATGAGITSTFGGAIAALTTNITGTGTVAFTGDQTGNITFGSASTATFTADEKVVGAIDATTSVRGAVTFAATATNTTLVSSTVGATKALTAVNVAPASGITATFAGAYQTATTTHSGAGTVAFSTTVGATTTSNINISGGGTVALTGAAKGGIDNTSGTSGTGTLTAATHVTGAIGSTNALATVTYSAAANQTGAVRATTVNVGSANTVAFDGNITGNLNFSADGTATETANSKIVGAVTTATTNTGTLTFATTTTNTTVASSTIGASGALLKAATFQMASGITATTGGDIYATTVTVDGADGTGVLGSSGNINATTLNFAAADGTLTMASGKSITAAITATDANDGTINMAGGAQSITGLIGVVGGNELTALNIQAGTTTIANNFAVATTTISASSVLKTSAAVTYEGAISNSGTLSVAGTLTQTASGGTTDLGAASGAELTLAASSYTGSIILQESASTVNITNAIAVNPHVSMAAGTYTLIDTNGGNGTADDTAKFSIADNALASYAISLNATSDVLMTVTKASASAVASTLGMDDSAGAAAVAASAGLTGTNLSLFNTAILAGGQTAKDAVNKSRPDAGSAGAGAVAGAGAAGGSIGGHQSDLIAQSGRYGLKKYTVASDSGVNSGSAGLNNGVWLQAFGSTSDMDTRNKVEGYDADVVGTTIGIDGQMSDNLTAGFAISYANIDVKGKSAAKSTTDTDQWQATLYGTLALDKFYVTGNAGYAFGDSDTSRTTISGTATGNYDTDTVSLGLSAAMPMDRGTFSLTPKAGVSYVHVNTDSYTEAGSNTLTVATSNMDLFHITAGFTAQTKIESGSGTLSPSASLTADWDVTQEQAESNANYSAGSTFTTKGAKPAALGGVVGLGLDYASNDGLYNISVGYDASVRANFVSHAGNVKLRYNF
ncbi:MAG: autotransporter domain-containing protein, partial [Magnetococcales bacterium]|nr:autotransporter domain-containing protein [Magnetococcales bacterium]